MSGAWQRLVRWLKGGSSPSFEVTPGTMTLTVYEDGRAEWSGFLPMCSHGREPQNCPTCSAGMRHA